jgi:hypothetical protein
MAGTSPASVCLQGPVRLSGQTQAALVGIREAPALDLKESVATRRLVFAGSGMLFGREDVVFQ